ncbi:protease 2 [Hordeum vulgare]|nr:protease 2 [Hordeum vulgare]
MSVLYRKDMAKLDGSDPMLLYGYGSYEVKAQDYPHILVTAGLNDPRVMYSEPAKFVAKLRELITGDNLLLFKCELGVGHFSKSGRFEKLREDAFTYAFILKALGMSA